MIIISLFDYSGNWSKPYHDNGFEVIQVDIKLGIDILTWDYSKIPKNKVYGILCAMDCTNYALSGARWFKEKDNDGRTAYSQKLISKSKEIIDYFDPVFWVLENPMSRIHKLNSWLGKPKFKFHPYEFGDEYQKMTWLWGKFNNPIKNPGENKGNWMFLRLGGKSDKTKTLRSNTPLKFAQAFYDVNH